MSGARGSCAGGTRRCGDMSGLLGKLCGIEEGRESGREGWVVRARKRMGLRIRGKGVKTV